MSTTNTGESGDSKYAARVPGRLRAVAPAIDPEPTIDWNVCCYEIGGQRTAPPSIDASAVAMLVPAVVLQIKFCLARNNLFALNGISAISQKQSTAIRQSENDPLARQYARCTRPSGPAPSDRHANSVSSAETPLGFLSCEEREAESTTARSFAKVVLRYTRCLAAGIPRWGQQLRSGGVHGLQLLLLSYLSRVYRNIKSKAVASPSSVLQLANVEKPLRRLVDVVGDRQKRARRQR